METHNYPDQSRLAKKKRAWVEVGLGSTPRRAVSTSRPGCGHQGRSGRRAQVYLLCPGKAHPPAQGVPTCAALQLMSGGRTPRWTWPSSWFPEVTWAAEHREPPLMGERGPAVPKPQRPGHHSLGCPGGRGSACSSALLLGDLQTGGERKTRGSAVWRGGGAGTSEGPV